MTLGELLKSVSFEDVHLVHKDEEINLATIVELNANTLTESGQEHWADILGATVTKIYEGGYGLQIECLDVKADRLAEFSQMLAGYVAADLYEAWVNENITEDSGPIMNM